jgi:peroxiredoxin
MNTKVNVKELAPDFELVDTKGEMIRLSAYRGKPVVLVLMRGFM